MITANDVLHIISEIHQYSMLLVELKDATVLGIAHCRGGGLSCFRYDGKLGQVERISLVRGIYEGQIPLSVHSLSVDQFLQEIEGKRARHIWLEAVGAERKELAFLSVSELKAYLRAQPHR